MQRENQFIHLSRNNIVEKRVLRYQRIRNIILIFERDSKVRKLSDNEMTDTAGDLATNLYVLLVDESKNYSILNSLDVKKWFFLCETKTNREYNHERIGRVSIEDYMLDIMR